MKDLELKERLKLFFVEGFAAGRQFERDRNTARAKKHSFPPSLERVDWSGVVGISKKFVDKRRKMRETETSRKFGGSGETGALGLSPYDKAPGR